MNKHFNVKNIAIVSGLVGLGIAGVLIFKKVRK